MVRDKKTVRLLNRGLLVRSVGLPHHHQDSWKYANMCHRPLPVTNHIIVGL